MTTNVENKDVGMNFSYGERCKYCRQPEEYHLPRHPYAVKVCPETMLSVNGCLQSNPEKMEMIKLNRHCLRC